MASTVGTQGVKQLATFAPAELRDGFLKLAQRNERSVSAELRIAVRERLEREGTATS
jgi:hypothetical protein